MMRITALVIFVLVSGIIPSFSQKGYDVRYVPDTLTATEVAEINAAAGNTPFRYYHLADSFSKISDSVNAGDRLLKIDPYLFLHKEQTPASIDAFLSKSFRLTKPVREAYTALFKKAYHSRKTRPYKAFKEMVEEDLHLRQQQEQCRNSECVSLTGVDIKFADSLHFDYLYRYVVKNGWPAIADGSLYAAQLLVHDTRHAGEYMPLMKKAVIEGKADITSLQTMAYWRMREMDYLRVLKYLEGRAYRSFDISSTLNNKLPDSLADIMLTVQKYCPVTPLVFCFFHNVHVDYAWTKKMLAINLSESVFSILNREMVNYDCGLDRSKRESMQAGLWTIYWMPTDDTVPKVILYLLHDKKDTIDFSRLLTARRFVTHDIHFDVNKSAIKPESINFIADLAAWLQSNPTIKLEIDGHTDSDGDPAANMKLSSDRANEVRKQLITRGVATDRLSTKGFGATMPVQPNTTDAGKAENRRVEFITQ